VAGHVVALDWYPIRAVRSGLTWPSLSWALAHYYIVIWGLSSRTAFSHNISQRVLFSEKKITEHKMRVLLFSPNFFWNISRSERIQPDIINAHRSSCTESDILSLVLLYWHRGVPGCLALVCPVIWEVEAPFTQYHDGWSYFMDSERTGRSRTSFGLRCGIFPKRAVQEIYTSTPSHEHSVSLIQSLQNGGGGGGVFDVSGGLPDVLNTKLCRGFFRTGLRSSGSRHYFERCGSTFDTNYQREPPTCCSRHGMNKMNPVTTTVMSK